jgi:hypothetical protein
MHVDSTHARRKPRRLQPSIPKCRHKDRLKEQSELQGPPFPKIQKNGFVNECINDWTDTLYLLAHDWGGLLRPGIDPLKRLMTLARKNSPELTIEDVKYHDWEGYNFLDKTALTRKAADVYSSLDSKWEKQREVFRKKIVQN